jgi:phytoene dehydrogenase-like protein
MASNYDVVVAGAGHNSLTAAAYLAVAGMRVLVLERNEWLGGGVYTREVTAPGFRHDLHSTGHMLIQANPLIAKDELGLQSRFGLEYKYPAITEATVFDDGTRILTYFDLDKTCESLAKISPKDAEAYRMHVHKTRQLLPMFVAGLFAPPAPLGTFLSVLEQSRQGRELIGIMNMSAYDIINRMFESDKIKIHFMKYSSGAMSAPEEKGTGLIFYMLVGFVHAYHGGFPVGGSGALTDALARCIVHHGGDLRTRMDVSRVIVKGGRALGVQTTSGEEFTASKVVIASIHPHLLDKYIAGIDVDIIADAKKTQPGGYSSMNTHYALHAAPSYPGLQGVEAPMMVECLFGDMEHFRRDYDELRYGRLPRRAGLTCATHTNHDPSRAPPGKATLYLYHFMPYELADGGARRWDDIKNEVADWMLAAYRKFTTNMDSGNIIARHVDSPLDYERASASFQRGDVSGIGRYLYQFLGRRPTPELSQYAVPGIGGLYLSGPFMHPGGGVIGGGRATAIKIMADLGLDFDRTIAQQQ